MIVAARVFAGLFFIAAAVGMNVLYCYDPPWFGPFLKLASVILSDIIGIVGCLVFWIHRND